MSINRWKPQRPKSSVRNSDSLGAAATATGPLSRVLQILQELGEADLTILTARSGVSRDMVQACIDQLLRQGRIVELAPGFSRHSGGSAGVCGHSCCGIAPQVQIVAGESSPHQNPPAQSRAATTWFRLALTSNSHFMRIASSTFSQ